LKNITNTEAAIYYLIINSKNKNPIIINTNDISSVISDDGDSIRNSDDESISELSQFSFIAVGEEY
jgi:hypothetical protein